MGSAALASRRLPTCICLFGRSAVGAGKLPSASRPLASHALPSHYVSLQIYNQSGYPDFISRVEKHGQHFGRTTHWLSYENSPR